MNRNQKMVIWFGTTTLFSLLLLIGIELQQGGYFILAIVQLVIALVLIMSKKVPDSNLTSFVFVLGFLWFIATFLAFYSIEKEANFFVPPKRMLHR